MKGHWSACGPLLMQRLVLRAAEFGERWLACTRELAGMDFAHVSRCFSGLFTFLRETFMVMRNTYDASDTRSASLLNTQLVSECTLGFIADALRAITSRGWLAAGTSLPDDIGSAKRQASAEGGDILASMVHSMVFSVNSASQMLFLVIEYTPDDALPVAVSRLQRSGAMDALCAALLSAPVLPPPPPGGAEYGVYVYRIALTMAIVGCFDTLSNLAQVASFQLAAGLKAVTAPSAVAMRRAGLLQIAASVADDADSDGGQNSAHVGSSAGGGGGGDDGTSGGLTDGADGAAGGGSDSGGAGGGSGGSNAGRGEGSRSGSSSSCGGGGSAAGLQLPPPEAQWLLLSAHHLRVTFGPKVQLTEVLDRFIRSATTPVQAAQDEHGLSRAVAAAKELLPGPVAAAAAVVARVCEAVCARLDFLGGRAAAPRNHTFQPPMVVESLMHVTQLLNARMRGADEDEVTSALPYVLEAHGWELRGLSSPAGPVLLSFEEKPGLRWLAKARVQLLAAELMGLHSPRSYRESPSCISDQEGVMWQRLPPSARQACVARLLRTGLPSSLDRLLRWAAANNGPGNAMALPQLALAGPLTELVGAGLARWRERVLTHALAKAGGGIVGGSSAGGSGEQEGPAAEPAGPAASGSGGGSAESASLEGEGNGEGDGEGEGGGGSAAASRATAEEPPPPVQSELGFLVTAAKLLGREVARLKEPGPGAGGSRCPPPAELMSPEPHAFALALLTVDVACNALPQATLAMTVPTSFPAAAAAEAEPVLTAARRTLAESLSLCCVPAVQLLAQLSDGAAEVLRRQPAWGRGQTAWDRTEAECVAKRAKLAAGAVSAAAAHLPAAALLAAAPQRALAALSRLHQALLRCAADAWVRSGSGAGGGGASARGRARGARGRGGGGGGGSGRGRGVSGGSGAPLDTMDPGVSRALSGTVDRMGAAIMLLSLEGTVRDGCVPGWLWAEEASEGGGEGGGECAAMTLNTEALGALWGTSEAGEEAALTGPVLTLRLDDAGGAFRGLRWADHAQHGAQVAAAARQRLQAAGLLAGAERPGAELSAAAAGGDESGPSGVWVTGEVRMCGNPACGSYGTASEAELSLRQCGGCRTVRYCGSECQKAHWRGGHKEECAAVAAARRS
ncbi:hypothetical protein HYH03_007023 [Edaphochlamys debaryana]|nr:hypothetical protein HYH03_007023 [Edaphochlamys debaryana]|eukprot:KAG2494780.1 hypothetical protein HYH03_007023 [Edaphochlamys debaryana]